MRSIEKNNIGAANKKKREKTSANLLVNHDLCTQTKPDIKKFVTKLMDKYKEDFRILAKN